MSLQNLQAELAELILSDEKNVDFVTPSCHLTIYHNNITANLKKTLRDTYPLIVKLVGNDFFEVVINEYIKHYPSRSSNLHDYGEYFSDFLAEYQPLKNLIYLTEVAQFEWICHTLFFASDHEALDTTVLDGLAQDQYTQLHFTLHPASQLMKFHYPILDIIDLCKGKQDEPLDINKGGVNLLIIRRELEITLVPLAQDDFTFLSALQENKSLAEALEEAMRINSDIKLEEKLPQWVKNKTIVDCYVAR